MIKWILRGTMFCILTISLLYFYTLKVEPKLLKVTKHEVPIEDAYKALVHIKIAQFTDTHVGAFYDEADMKKIVEKLNELEPDIVVFTGDLVDHWREYDDREDLQLLLKEIKAPLGKFAVFGNHDYGGGGYKVYEEFMEKSGFKVLVNEVYSLIINEDIRLNIAGLDDMLLGNPRIKELMQQLKLKDYNILLAHEPDVVNQLPKDKIDLQLSGHSHGGQVQIPGLVDKIVPLYAKEYTEGMYHISPRTRLYVNTGIGSTQLPFRLGNIPEISLFTFKNQ